jgi:CheY-like chemotaxis protein/anti-sigma regulatory factor (Ser/Thr protein kinase)
MEAIGTLAGGIAHDFNNILTPLMGYAELALGRMAPDGPVRDDISQVLAAARRAVELVRQILAISRHDKIDAQVPVALDLLVKETVRFLRASFPANVEIGTRLEPGCPPVFGDSGQLQQVLINLCTNARDAMLPKGGVLDIAIESAEGPGGEPLVRLSVGDTGDGIPPGNLDRIFDPYFTTKPKGKGTGLGLAVTQGIVRGLGGRIHAESVVGRGSVFVVTLPASKGAVPLPQGEASSVVPRPGGGHVLVVDDEEAIRKLLARMLPTLGYGMTACSDAGEALALLRAAPSRFDAVLTDYTMPGMLGLDLAREVLRIRPDLPVPIGSGFAEGIDEEAVRKTGLSGFLSKPYTLAYLGDALGRAMGG